MRRTLKWTSGSTKSLLGQKVDDSFRPWKQQQQLIIQLTQCALNSI